MHTNQSQILRWYPYPVVSVVFQSRVFRTFRLHVLRQENLFRPILGMKFGYQHEEIGLSQPPACVPNPAQVKVPEWQTGRLGGPHIARYCDSIAAIPPLAGYFLSHPSITPIGFDNPPWCLVLHRHISAIPHFATYRAILVQYLSRTLKSTKIRGVPRSEFSGSQKRGDIKGEVKRGKVVGERTGPEGGKRGGNGGKKGARKGA